MAESQVLMAVTSVPVAATGEEAAEEDTDEVNTAKATEYIAAIEAATEAFNAVDDPNYVLVTTTETEAPTETEASNAQKPAETEAPTETQQAMEAEATTESEKPIETDESMRTETADAAEKSLNVALVRAEKRATILQEAVENQVASLEEFRAAHTLNAAVAAETDNIVDTNFVEALDLVLQEHKQEQEDATANLVDCQEELNTRVKKK
jgi:hypothetical protein